MTDSAHNFRFLNTGTVVSTHCYPYVSECGLLVTLLDLDNDFGGNEIPLRLPCQCDSTVYVILAYLRTGLLPRLITDPSYTDVLVCLKYLHSSAVGQVTLDDRLLNNFHLADEHINRSLSLRSMYDSDGQLYPVDSAPMKYPVLAVVKKFPVFPQTKEKALSNLLECTMGRCNRRQFVDNVMSKCPALVLAGGSLQFCRLRKFSRCSCSSDLDFFLLTCPEVSLADILIMIGEEYYRCFGSYFSLKTVHTVSFFRLTSGHRNTVQLVLKYYSSVPHLLDSFDLDSSCFAYYQGDIWYSDRGGRVLACGYNIVDVRRRSPSFEYRLLKYHHKYGIGIAVPGFLYYRLERTRPPHVGLSRLLHGLNSTSRISDYEVSGRIVQSQCPYTLLNNLKCLAGTGVFPSIDLKFNSPVMDAAASCDTFPGPSFTTKSISDGWFFQAYGGDQQIGKVLEENCPKIDTETSENETVHLPGQQCSEPKRPATDDWSIDIGGFKISSLTTGLHLAYYLEQATSG